MAGGPRGQEERSAQAREERPEGLGAECSPLWLCPPSPPQPAPGPRVQRAGLRFLASCGRTAPLT